MLDVDLDKMWVEHGKKMKYKKYNLRSIKMPLTDEESIDRVNPYVQHDFLCQYESTIDRFCRA